MRIILIYLFLLFFIPKNSNAAPVFFTWGGESVQKIVDFPDNENFISRDNQYFDAGFRYKQITIFFIPVWNYEIKWCGYISDNYFLDLSKTELDQYANIAQVALPQEPELDFWNVYGGKLLFSSILIIYIMYNIYFKKDA